MGGLRGRIVAYQFGAHHVAFRDESTMDRSYLSGVSITHGKPRKHIWSFASEMFDNSRCPCLITKGHIETLLPLPLSEKITSVSQGVQKVALFTPLL